MQFYYYKSRKQQQVVKLASFISDQIKDKIKLIKKGRRITDSDLIILEQPNYLAKPHLRDEFIQQAKKAYLKDTEYKLLKESDLDTVSSDSKVLLLT